MNARPSAWRNRVFLKIWLASLVSGTAVAAHETAATWMMNLMSSSGLFISLMASLSPGSVASDGSGAGDEMEGRPAPQDSRIWESAAVTNFLRV
jgi:hypothetical protein